MSAEKKDEKEKGMPFEDGVGLVFGFLIVWPVLCWVYDLFRLVPTEGTRWHGSYVITIMCLLFGVFLILWPLVGFSLGTWLKRLTKENAAAKKAKRSAEQGS